MPLPPVMSVPVPTIGPLMVSWSEAPTGLRVTVPLTVNCPLKTTVGSVSKVEPSSSVTSLLKLAAPLPPSSMVTGAEPEPMVNAPVPSAPVKASSSIVTPAERVVVPVYVSV